mmetsp:Transcript_84904/g.164664  ORF Transcript_84904/g.164664 Transcript_84904/m.164664 type:complete len:377 (-) Transcript_84904:198-1328(-)
MPTTQMDSSNMLLQKSVPMPLIYAVLALGAAVHVGLLSPRGLTGIISLVVFLVGLLVYYQESVLYIPVIQGWKTPADNPSGYQSPSQHAMAYEDVYFRSADDTKLHGWFLPAPPSVLAQALAQGGRVPTVLFCHENAGNIGLRIPEFKQVHDNLRVNQFVFDYRGYGHSKGTPSEVGLVADAVAAYEWVAGYKQSSGAPSSSNIVVVGRSLGGAVAVSLVAKLHAAAGKFKGGGQKMPAALIIENSFTSISDMVDAKFPILNVPYFKGLFLRLKWDSLTAIKTLPPSLPILFLSSTNDEIVPAAQMHALKNTAADAAANAVRNRGGGGSKGAAFAAERTIVSFDATHNDIWAAGGDAYWAAKESFLRTHCGSGSAS